jgi:hypothetical protein
MINTLPIRQKILLLVLFFIFILRFILTPLLQWQEVSKEAISTLYANLPEKSQVVAQNSQLSKNLLASEQTLKKNKQQFLTFERDFKLNFIAKVKDLYKQYQLESKTIGWSNKSIVQESFTVETLQLTLEGSALDFVNWLIEFESVLGASKYTNIRISKARGKGMVVVSLKINFYFIRLV